MFIVYLSQRQDAGHRAGEQGSLVSLDLYDGNFCPWLLGTDYWLHWTWVMTSLDEPMTGLYLAKNKLSWKSSLCRNWALLDYSLVCKDTRNDSLLAFSTCNNRVLPLDHLCKSIHEDGGCHWWQGLQEPIRLQWYFKAFIILTTTWPHWNVPFCCLPGWGSCFVRS